MDSPTWWQLPNERLRFRHGPIDLTLKAEGARVEVSRAYRAAHEFSQHLLQDLSAELATLRKPITPYRPPKVHGAVARRLVEASWVHRETFVTPMAAVAGGIADSLLATMVEHATLSRAYVNDGGDIAIHLTPSTHHSVGVISNVDAPQIIGDFDVTYDTPVRGIATSGVSGRSHSLGVADAVSVLACSAAAADVAATLIANAVNVESSAVERCPAEALNPDTDLLDQWVTTKVGRLREKEIMQALAAGEVVARRMQRTRRIHGAVLVLQGHIRVVDAAAHPESIKILANAGRFH